MSQITLMRSARVQNTCLKCPNLAASVASARERVARTLSLEYRVRLRRSGFLAALSRALCVRVSESCDVVLDDGHHRHHHHLSLERESRILVGLRFERLSRWSPLLKSSRFAAADGGRDGRAWPRPHALGPQAASFFRASPLVTVETLESVESRARSRAERTIDSRFHTRRDCTLKHETKRHLSRSIETVSLGGKKRHNANAYRS